MGDASQTRQTEAMLVRAMKAAREAGIEDREMIIDGTKIRILPKSESATTLKPLEEWKARRANRAQRSAQG